ncbi:hypothetical protein PR002_g28709 [Phytophthora rubi]|uniref:Uncharacterized protein n=1 Tax=Phytophthora rubi TaxID=129364 RepID=A0A6A3H6R2_9STRA|nr:hypothetical protein PR002_g28709 [Phytophthora rubi]
MGSVGKGVPQRRRESIGKGKRDSKGFLEIQ